MRGRRLRKHHLNPYRRVAGVETRTWLPDDAGTFTDPDADVHSEDDVVTLPDGREVEVEFIAAGNWTRAYRGADGWVYLFSKADPAKELIVETMRKTADKPWSIHLPWIERIGVEPGDSVVYRMPFYEPLDRRNLKTAKELRRVEEEVRADPMVGEDELAFEIARGVGALAREDAERFGGISKAVKHLADAMDRAGWDYEANFEFPVNNLAQDVEGNLVLLDVFFRSETPGLPVPGWKPAPGGIDADFGD